MQEQKTAGVQPGQERKKKTKQNKQQQSVTALEWITRARLSNPSPRNW